MIFYKASFLALFLASTLYAASNMPQEGDLEEITTPLAAAALHTAEIPAAEQPGQPLTPIGQARANQVWRDGQSMNLQDLPLEALEHIFSFLDHNDLTTCGLTSRSMHSSSWSSRSPQSLDTHRSSQAYLYDSGQIRNLNLNPDHLKMAVRNSHLLNDTTLVSWLESPLGRLQCLKVHYTQKLRSRDNCIQPQTMKLLGDTLIKPVSSSLHVLSLKDCLDSSSCAPLVNILKTNQTLQSLQLEDNYTLESQNITDLLQAIIDNPQSSIKELGFRVHCKQFANTPEQIANPNSSLLVHLVDAHRLSSLDLFGCRLGLEKAIPLLQALKTNTSLTSLNLGVNDLGLMGGTYVVEMLKHNTTLLSLGLTGNKLEESGSVEIMRVFIDDEDAPIQNTTLRDLNISHNGVINYGNPTYAICELVRTNTTLRSLDLMNSHIGLRATVDVLSSLKQNPHTALRSLNLKGSLDLAHIEGLKANHIPAALQDVVLL